MQIAFSLFTFPCGVCHRMEISMALTAWHTFMTVMTANNTLQCFSLLGKFMIFFINKYFNTTNLMVI